jgi:hypothetical protein
VTLAQNQLQLAQSNPQIHNLYEAYRRMYTALGVKDVEQILPIPQGPQPRDPALEHSVVLMGQPLQAFMEQSHDLHIKAHRTFMSSSLVRTNPMAVVNLVSHINQHVSMLAQQVVDRALVAEEAEAMQEQNMDPLVLLKQQELALRQQDLELKAQQQGEQQGLRENQFEYKQDLDAMKLQKDYDLADLRARVALERANATKQEG